MVWVIVIIIALIVIGMSDVITSQFWLTLLALVIGIVILYLLIRKQKRKKIIQSPEFQALLQQVTRLRAICMRMENRIGEPRIAEYDTFSYTPIKTYDNDRLKKPFTPEESATTKNDKLYFQVVIEDNPTYIRNVLNDYLDANRRYRDHDEVSHANRWSAGYRLLLSLFASREDAEDFMKLTHYEEIDIAFDCIDMYPDDHNWLVFHFQVPGNGIVCDKNKFSLFMKELNVPSKPGRKAKKHKSSKQSKPVRIPTYGQGNVQVYQCTCGTKFRVPTDKGNIVATCPNANCRKKWYI